MDEDFKRFVDNWMQKAEAYGFEDVLAHFDRFFTLYVVYNKLFTEIWHRNHPSNVAITGKKIRYSDKHAAIDGVAQYIGGEAIVELLARDAASAEALRVIVESIRNHHFHITLSDTTGIASPEEDNEILSSLLSEASNMKATGILTVLYRVRCNLFHGRKQFVPRQVELLKPCNVILKHLIITMSERLFAQ